MLMRQVACNLFLASACLAGVTLSEGSKLRLRLEQTISSSTADEGQTVEFVVAEPIEVDGTVVIKEGARATGTVTQAYGKRRMGRAGKLDFSIDRVSAADGKWIPVRYTLMKKSGESHAVRTGIITAGVAVAFWPAAPAFLLMKGKDITINKGVTFDVFTDAAHSLDSAKPARKEIAAAAPPAPPAASHSLSNSASITVTSPVPGADIELNGHFVGNTPTTLHLPPGKHDITVRSGAMLWQRSIQVTAGSTVSLTATWTQRAGVSGAR